MGGLSSVPISFFDPPNDGGIDIPGPIDRSDASHWIVYDHRRFKVETWCTTGPQRFALRTRVRPMSRDERIHSKLRQYSRDEVLKAYGVDKEQNRKQMMQMTREIYRLSTKRYFNILTISLLSSYVILLAVTVYLLFFNR